MGKPSVATQKRLYAVSGNRCAFRNCPQPLVDEATGKVTARICHIKGNKPTSKRHDPGQSEEERQGFDNLVLMCPIHHDVIDADDKTYTHEVLRQIKAEHEAKYKGWAPGPRAAELFLANVQIEVSEGAIVLSANQSGGQTAYVIHNNYGTAPQQPSGFRKELVARHLADVDDPEFGRTTYGKKLGVGEGPVRWLGTAAVAFAHSPRPILAAADEDELVRWADVNRLRYEPCKPYPFLPGVYPDRIGSALVWTNARTDFSNHTHLRFTRYVAVERAGFVEFGFAPVSAASYAPPVYYASALGNLVGFLAFLRELFAARGIDPDCVSLGFGLRGIRGAGLECITTRLTREFGVVTPPQRDLLYLRTAEDGPWCVDSVAHSVAESILDHWEFSRPGWLKTPEFEAGRYTGEFFKSRVQSWSV